MRHVNLTDVLASTIPSVSLSLSAPICCIKMSSSRISSISDALLTTMALPNTAASVGRLFTMLS